MPRCCREITGCQETQSRARSDGERIYRTSTAAEPSCPQTGELRLERLDLAAALRELLAERVADERVLRLLGLELGDRRGGLAEDLALGLGVRAAEQRLELVDAVVDALAPFPLDLFLRARSAQLDLEDAHGLLSAR